MSNPQSKVEGYTSGVGRVAEWFGFGSGAVAPPQVTREVMVRDGLRIAPFRPIEPGRFPVTAQRALGLPAVFACARIVHTTALQLPVRAYQGQRPAALPEWLRRPEAWNGNAARLRQVVESLVLGQVFHGAGYLWCDPEGFDSWDVRPIAPDRVDVELIGGERVWRVDGRPVPLARRWSTRSNTAGLAVAPFMFLPGVARPVGPIQAARHALSGALDVEDYAATVFTSGTVSGGRLETDLDITPESAQRYQDYWMEKHAVPPEQRAIPVLGSGLKYVNDLLNPRDAQWIEARQYNAQDVARLFGVPPRYLGLPSGDASTYATARDNDAALMRFCVAGYTRPIEDLFDALTPPGRGADEDLQVRFDFDAMLSTTPADRADQYGKALAGGWLTVDEVRAMEGLPPLPAPEPTPPPAPEPEPVDVEDPEVAP